MHIVVWCEYMCIQNCTLLVHTQKFRDYYFKEKITILVKIKRNNYLTDSASSCVTFSKSLRPTLYIILYSAGQFYTLLRKIRETSKRRRATPRGLSNSHNSFPLLLYPTEKPSSGHATGLRLRFSLISRGLAQPSAHVRPRFARPHAEG